MRKESFEATDVESTGKNCIGNYEAFAWVQITEISELWIHVDVESELIDMLLEMESYQRSLMIIKWMNFKIKVGIHNTSQQKIGNACKTKWIKG